MSPDRRGQPGLLDDLAHQCVARVLAVVEAAAGQGPQLGAADARREAAQQHFRDARAGDDPHDHGVGRHALSSRQGSHAPNLPRRFQPCRSVTPVAATQRDPWLDNTKMALVTLVVIGHSMGLSRPRTCSHWLYDFLYLWHIPAFVFISGYLSKSFEWTPPALQGPALHPGRPLPHLRAGALLLPRLHRGRAGAGSAVAQPALDDVVPHRAADAGGW